MASNEEETPSRDLKIKIVTNDAMEFVVDQRVANAFKVIHDMLETLRGGYEDGDVQDFDTPVRLQNVRGDIMKEMLDWVDHHKDDPDTSDEEEQYRDRRTDDIPQWDKNFVGRWEKPVLYEVLQACNYLDLRPLLEICCKTIANMIKGKSVEQVREILQIQSDYTPEEEEQLKKENAWAEDLTN
ncbi:Suppressor of kinetochore protein 1 [Halotydeus destructor]|nr:Suppressor of kinetochore protein 1 [Halotydeus destructor]